MRKPLLAALLAVVFTVAFISVRAAPAPAIRVDTGLLAGVTHSNGVTSYKGIPFAAPPVGNLRWQPPQPVAHWTGIRRADHFGASCIQDEPGERLPWTKQFMTQGPISEDCLFLNVWTAAKSSKEHRPVMVWIYGGGFSEGSSSVDVYDGAALAKNGVVLVSMNYRVGMLGFLAYPGLTQESPHHSSGNYGLLDQIAALQWVRQNIAAFGGDPNRVTIFGQSAGAISVADLMESPLAKGLFARAIAESGPGLIPQRMLGSATLADREKAGLKYAESKGAHSLAELRALPASDFVPTGGPSGGPVADGWVLPLTGNQPSSEVPLIVGFVAEDITLGGAGFGPAPKPSVSSYQENARKKYGDRAATYLKLYPASSDAEAAEMQKTSGRDQARVSLDLWAADQVKKSARVYTYYFDRVLPWPAHPEFGAFHSSELPYVFENLEIFRRPWTPLDGWVSAEISSYWTNFAANGSPNGTGLAHWPAYSPTAHVTMEIGRRTGFMPDAAPPARLTFFLDYLTHPASPAAAGGQ
jgi:para-nitrobenzyl esterase